MHERDDAGAARTARVAERVIRFLEEAAPLTAWTGSDVALFGDGRIDSLALVNLVTWVEEQIGARIDPATIGLLTALMAGEWEIVDAASAHSAGAASGLIAAYAQWHLERGIRSLQHVEAAR